jgi:hypothetical protein
MPPTELGGIRALRWLCQKFVATSSMTKLVWSEESSVAANFRVMLVPL